MEHIPAGIVSDPFREPDIRRNPALRFPQLGALLVSLIVERTGKPRLARLVVVMRVALSVAP
jgi:hypothetical protein